MNFKVKFVLVLFLGIFMAIFFGFRQGTCKKLSCLNINIEGFNESQIYENSSDLYRALYKNDLEDMIKVEKKKLKLENVKSTVNSEAQRINAYFENAISPYPGQISDEIECPKEFRPTLETKDINGEKASYFEVFLTERLTIGACSDEQAKYKEIIAWYYCPNQENLYQIEIVSNKERFTQNKDYFYAILDSISCK